MRKETESGVLAVNRESLKFQTEVEFMGVWLVVKKCVFLQRQPP